MITEQVFLNESGFTAYSEYLAIKRHFTTKYDYFKYNGKVNVSKESFEARRDAYQFQRLSKKRDYKNLILSNIVNNPKAWVGSLLEDSANETYLEWKKRNDAITRHVQDSLSKLDDDFKTNFVSTNGQYPHVIDLFLRKEISLEAVTILTKMTNSSDYWKKTVIDKVVFPDILGQIDKYHPFIVYLPEKMKKVIKTHFF
jgi:hypothetical protein